MKRNKIYTTFACAALLTLGACDDYLDTMPDNRATIDTEEKVTALLVSAYPDHDYNLLTEACSDNVDDMGLSNPRSTRFIEQVYYWEDVTESDNESPEQFWQASYNAIAVANQALQSIEEMGGATTTTLQQAQAEALLCRAYNHFMLVNVFALNYNSETSATDPGVTYMTEPETTVLVDYERNSVAEVYELIEKDLEAALPYVSDSYMSVPKYHFNPTAAYAFACRFYLYYEKWDKAIEYADLVLGSSPKTMLRDYEYMGSMTQDDDAVTQHYIDATLNCNLLLLTGYSRMGTFMGAYTTWKRFAHSPYTANYEDAGATNIWGSSRNYYSGLKTYAGTNFSFSIFWRLPYLFEYTDAVAGIGYNRCVFPAFTTDECLLNRAEAKVMQKQYDEAAEDLDIWMHNFMETSLTLDPDTITNFYKKQSYSEPLSSTIKKHLNPAFEIDAEGSTQECMLQCVLGFRRIETLQLGMRWFDVKRYGIEICRRVMNASGTPETLVDILSVDDPRRAMQIPATVVDAGYEPNPRD
ncbi:MAG: RagB/SusD family nutrient uptake outer membrane protein [Bacteroides sp.]|nr:RagB/SusD family nutrient uptake outer membrane protein [Bacteroides sp.]